MLHTTLRSLVVLVALTSLAYSQQNGSFNIQSGVNGSTVYVDLNVSGPANSFFDVWYALDLSGTGLTHLTGGNLGTSGHWSLTAQVPASIQIPHLWVGAVVTPVSGPPYITGFGAIAVNGVLVPPCFASGAMSWNPATCQIALSAKVCPGDVIDIQVNGVSVATSAPAGPDGVVLLGIGGFCALPAGSTITATRNGAPFLGPITT